MSFAGLLNLGWVAANAQTEKLSPPQQDIIVTQTQLSHATLGVLSSHLPI